MAKMMIINIILLLVLSYECAFANCLNFTRLLEERLGSQYHVASQFLHDYPTIQLRDVSYLPENIEIHRDLIQMMNDNGQFERIHRNLLPDYRNLCETRTRKVQLSDTEFEYQPPHYHEIYCKNYSQLDSTVGNSVKPARQTCAAPGFHCVQRSRILFIVRRRWANDCWEPFTKEIASGCDCMWPVSTLGDISVHY